MEEKIYPELIKEEIKEAEASLKYHEENIKYLQKKIDWLKMFKV